MAFFLQPKGGGGVLLRVLWFTALAGAPKDPVSGYPLYKRWAIDHPTLPPLVPLQSVLGVEHFVHFCGAGDTVCDVQDGQVQHCYHLNDCFVHRPRPAGRNL